MKSWLDFKQQDINRFQETNTQFSAGSSVDSVQPSADSKCAELASCDIRYAIFFCFLFSIVGYSYTGRFKAFGIFLVGGVVALLGFSYALSEQVTQSKKMQMPLALSISAIAAADNSRAILSARRTIRREK